MHNTNFTHLANRLKDAGFGQALNESLQSSLKGQPTSFELPHKICFGREVLEITVYIKKWKEQDDSHVNMYYLQKYHASLSQENMVDRIEQDFYFSHPSPAVTIQEAYNLLSGRAVYRENLTSKDKINYSAWVQLDFKQTDSRGNFKWQFYHENYGYDLAGELMKYPILGLSVLGAGEQLMTALKQGYREAVTMLVNGKEELYYIEALPRFKSLVIYDGFENPLNRSAMSALIASPDLPEKIPSK